MNASEFEQQMAQDGFTKPIPGQYEADRFNNDVLTFLQG